MSARLPTVEAWPRSHVSPSVPVSRSIFPAPARAAAPLVALALVALLLAASPSSALAGRGRGAAFSLAAAGARGPERRALPQLRATVDRLIVRDRAAAASPLVVVALRAS